MVTLYKGNSYLPKAGLYLAILGVVSLVAFVLIFQEDWMNRYPAMIAMIPISLLAMLLIKKLPLVCGLLLVALGIAALVLDILLSTHPPGEITGRGIGYTLVFVSLPLVISGILFFLWGRKHK